MVLSAQHFDGVPVAVMPADVDIANAARVGEALAEAVGREAPCLIVDLSETRYLDSAALNMLFALNERLLHRRQTLRLVVAPGALIIRVLQIASLESATPVHPTVADALEASRADRSDSPEYPARPD
jgi:anti-sigma B factor antagonist